MESTWWASRPPFPLAITARFAEFDLRATTGALPFQLARPESETEVRRRIPTSVRAHGGRAVRWMWRSGHREQLTKSLRPTISAMHGSVLDIGGGRDSPLAANWPDRVTRVRVDISAEFGPDVQADAARLPIVEGAFDGVIMSEVLEHIPNPRAVVDEVLRILKPGGTFAGSVPFLAQGIHADPHDYYRYTEAALRLLMTEFEDVQVTPHGNGFGVAWRMVLVRLKFLLPLNPIARQMSRSSDAKNAEGYTFTALKPTGVRTAQRSSSASSTIP